MQSHNGFTLVEISVVLVILALLTSGILGGKTMIEESRYSAWVEQIDSYRAAFQAFQMEYGEPPGDFRDATSAFSSVTTYDGNGDGAVFGHTSSIGANSESANATQHLILAGLIAGDPEATDQSRPTPVGGYFRFIRTGNEGNGIRTHKITFINIPLDFARRLDRDLDDGYDSSGKITHGSGTAVRVYVDL